MYKVVKSFSQLLAMVGALFTNEAFAVDSSSTNNPAYFYSHCIDMDEDLEFNGSKNYLCDFKGEGIQSVYTMYKTDLYHHEVLKKVLPTADSQYLSDEVEVNYKWLPPNKLRLTVTANGGNEQYIYYFIETDVGTTVFTQLNTQY